VLEAVQMVRHSKRRRSLGLLAFAILNCFACAAPSQHVCASIPATGGPRVSEGSQKQAEVPKQFERPLLSLANCPAQPALLMQVEMAPQDVHDIKCDQRQTVELSYSKMCAVAEALVNVEAFSQAPILMLIPDDAVTAMYNDTSLGLRARTLTNSASAIVFVDTHGTIVFEEDAITSYFRVEPAWSQNRLTIRACGRTAI